MSEYFLNVFLAHYVTFVKKALRVSQVLDMNIDLSQNYLTKFIYYPSPPSCIVATHAHTKVALSYH